MKMEDFHCAVSPFGFFIFAEETNTLLSIIFSFIILLSWFVAQVEILWLPLLRCAVCQILAPFDVVTSDIHTHLLVWIYNACQIHNRHSLRQHSRPITNDTTIKFYGMRTYFNAYSCALRMKIYLYMLSYRPFFLSTVNPHISLYHSFSIRRKGAF